jgi:hypothetical protein
VLLAMAVPIMADLVANVLSAGLDRSALIADGG